MKIKLLSDLHLEFADYKIPYDGEDVLILAGDISPSYQETVNLINTYLQLSETAVVILVLGNHDYYGGSINYVDCLWDWFENDRVYFLQDDSIVLQGVRFYGTTMWTDMNGANKKTISACAKYINDFHCIKNFTPISCIREHINSRDMLKKALKDTYEPIVVITHHLPSYKSIVPQYEDDPCSGAFASTDLDDLVTHEKVILWCHGHTHSSLDYLHGTTRVVCNPRGYEGENTQFDEHLLIDLNNN